VIVSGHVHKIFKAFRYIQIQCVAVLNNKTYLINGLSREKHECVDEYNKSL